MPEAELLEREDLLANRLKRFRALAPESTLLPVYEIWLALRENREDVARAALAHLQRQEGESPLAVQLDDSELSVRIPNESVPLPDGPFTLEGLNNVCASSSGTCVRDAFRSASVFLRRLGFSRVDFCRI